MPDDDRADNERDERPCRVPKWKKCLVEGCTEEALSFRDKCWEHMEKTEREEFQEEIVKRARSESLRGADLASVDLHLGNPKTVHFLDPFR